MTLAYKARGSCRVDLKSTVVHHRLTFLLINIGLNHLIRDIPRTHCHISTCPKMPTPELLPQMRKLLQQYPRTRPFQPLYRLADTLRRSVPDKHVHMICRNFAGNYVQLMLHRYLPQNITCSYRHRTDQHPLSVLRDPYQMNLQIRLCMCPKPISSHCDIIQSLLRLKARGFHHPR